jgi:hypothetical protein
MEHDIEDFNRALNLVMMEHFGSLKEALEYGDMLEEKNKKREEAFIKKIKEKHLKYDKQT